MQRVLIIDDNSDVAKALEVQLGLHDIQADHAAGPEDGLAAIGRGVYDLVIQDMNFDQDTTSGREGVQLFHQIRDRDPDLPVILLTAWADLETAVDLVKAGAADYLSKPWDDQKLVATVTNLLELRELQRRQRDMSRQRMQAHRRLAAEYDLCGAVYASDAMHQVLSLATQVAPADVSILITGPNGTGKDVVAQIIQANSNRRDAPFVTLNVGALPNDLMEAELFGAEPGAYTGASKVRRGRFEAADGGTLFLDEIGNLSAEGQMKLLRVLQTGEYERLGSSATRSADVRVISATNSDLTRAIADGEFREDLYYRLNVIEIRLPPLSQRRDDILPLAYHFLGETARLTAAAEESLLQHPWPGNVRELKNIIQRATLLCKNNRVAPADLGLPGRSGPGLAEPAGDPMETDEPGEREIRDVLEQMDGNVSRAARHLGLSRQALYRRMAKFDIRS